MCNLLIQNLTARGNGEWGRENSEFGIRNSEEGMGKGEFGIRNSEFGRGNGEWGISLLAHHMVRAKRLHTALLVTNSAFVARVWGNGSGFPCTGLNLVAFSGRWHLATHHR